MDGEYGAEWFEPMRENFGTKVVDGVPVLFAESSGLVHAGIAFRVGAADERLPDRGLTHLIEHLALHGFTGSAAHRNGMTGATLTSFTFAGSEPQAVEFLNHICSALRKLPLDRLEAERAILGVEGQSRSASADVALLQVRFGMNGFARVPTKEFGAETATADRVVEWSRRWFVRGNAVAWISTATAPDGLDLRLPEGERIDFVHPPTLAQVRPAWFPGQPGRALVDAVLPRSSAAVLLSEVLSRALFRRLRIERGLSYEAGAHYEPLDADVARIMIVADASADLSEDLVDELGRILADVRDGVFDPVDVREARAHIGAAFDVTPSGHELLGGLVYRYLVGGKPEHPRDHRARLEAVTDEELAAVGRVLWDDAIWQTPVAEATIAGVSRLPDATPSALDGLSYFHATTHERIVFGADGVSVVVADGAHTVRYDQCDLVLQYGDGGRLLVGHDATSITIEPTVLRLFGESELAALDAAVPPDSIVRLPARPADSIPVAPPIEAARSGLGTWALIAAIPMLLIAVQMFVIGADLASRVGSVRADGTLVTASSVGAATTLGLLLVIVAGTLLVAWIARLRSRRPRR